MEGLYWGCSEPLTVLQKPIVLTVAFALWGLGREGRRTFLGEKRPLLGLRAGSGRSRKLNMSRARWGLEVDGAASQRWRSQSLGFVRGEVGVGGT